VALQPIFKETDYRNGRDIRGSLVADSWMDYVEDKLLRDYEEKKTYFSGRIKKW